jgi:hypothetical protein
MSAALENPSSSSLAGAPGCVAATGAAFRRWPGWRPATGSEFASDRSRSDEDLAPAHGIVAAVVIGAGFWIVLGDFVRACF